MVIDVLRTVRRARLALDRDLLLGDLLHRLAAADPDRVLVDEVGGPRRTLAEAADVVDRWAAAVAQRTDPGQVVVVATPNGYDQLLLCLAASRAGAVPAPVNDTMREAEVDHVVADAEAALVVRAAEDLPTDEALGRCHPASSGDVAAVFYTSGTTGKPKGAELTHRGILGGLNTAALLPVLGGDELALFSLPMAHIMGLASALGLACAGLPVRFLRRFDPVAVLDEIERCRPDVYVGVPAMYRMLLDAGAEDRDLASVKMWLSGADAMPAELSERFSRMGAAVTLPLVGRVGRAVFAEGYGMVETAGGVAARVALPYVPSAVGRLGVPLPGYQTRVVDEGGGEVGRGSVGELQLSGPGVLKGYRGDEGATRGAFTDDGWLRTGDLVRRGPFGVFTFEGRAKDVIVRGGYNVYAVEVEQALDATPTWSRRPWWATPTTVSERSRSRRSPAGPVPSRPPRTCGHGSRASSAPTRSRCGSASSTSCPTAAPARSSGPRWPTCSTRSPTAPGSVPPASAPGGGGHVAGLDHRGRGGRGGVPPVQVEVDVELPVDDLHDVALQAGPVGRGGEAGVAEGAELLLVGLPVPGALPVAVRGLGPEGVPALLRVVAQVLEDHVAGAGRARVADVAVEDRAAVVDLRGQLLGAAALEGLVAQADVEAVLAGREHRRPPQHQQHHRHAHARHRQGPSGVARGPLHRAHRGGGAGALTGRQSGGRRHLRSIPAPAARHRVAPVTRRDPGRPSHPWTCSSTRASSSSPPTTSRSRPATSPPPSTRRWRRPRPSDYPVVVKAQVQVGGRGKAGGIKLADTAEEARTHAEAILGIDIKGHTVKRVWIEKASDIAEEYYASFTLDRSAKKHLGMLSAQGGVEIEAVAETDPDAIAKIWVDPVDGLTEDVARDWVAAAKLDDAATEGAVDILLKLYRAYVDGDADLVEINPLILTPDGRVHALDAKVTLDANAAFRHDLWEYEATQERDAREQAAHDKGLQYVGLDGSVGVIANGAGLAMSTVDIVNQVGGSPANFLDIGGGANADVMAGALEVITSDPAVRASSSTSSAASPRATRWPTASSPPSGGSTSRSPW